MMQGSWADMLTEQEVLNLLRASRSIPLPEGSFHGPLGLEQLADCVANIMNSPNTTPAQVDAAPASGEVVRGT
jgi:hypothetical protein